MSGLIGGAGSKSGIIGESFGRIIVPGFLCRPTSDITNLTQNSSEIINWGTVKFDTHSAISGTTMTAPVAGVWNLCADLSYNSPDYDYNYLFFYFASGREGIYSAMSRDQSSTERTGNVLQATVKLDKGETCQVKNYIDGGSGNTDIMSWSHFSGHLVG